KLPIQREQLEVSLGHFTQHRKRYIAPGFLARQELSPGGFVEPPNTAPQINLPGNIPGSEKAIESVAAIEHCGAAIGILAASHTTLVIQLREESRPVFLSDCARLFDTGDSNAQIIII